MPAPSLGLPNFYCWGFAVASLLGWPAVGFTTAVDLATAGAGREHPVSISAAYVLHKGSKLQVAFEVRAEDLVWYHGLNADELDQVDALELEGTADDHGDFLLEYFQIEDEWGRRLSGNVTYVGAPDWPGRAIPQVELQQLAIAYGLEFQLPPPRQPQPESNAEAQNAEPQPRSQILTFLQNYGGDANELPALLTLTIECRDSDSGERTSLEPRIMPRNSPLTFELYPDGSAQDRNRARCRIEAKVEKSQVILECPLSLLADRLVLRYDDSSAFTASEQEALTKALHELVGGQLQAGFGKAPGAAKTVRFELLPARASSGRAISVPRRSAHLRCTLDFPGRNAWGPGDSGALSWQDWTSNFTRIECELPTGRKTWISAARRQITWPLRAPADAPQGQTP